MEIKELTTLVAIGSYSLLGCLIFLFLLFVSRFDLLFKLDGNSKDDIKRLQRQYETLTRDIDYFANVLEKHLENHKAEQDEINYAQIIDILKNVKYTGKDKGVKELFEVFKNLSKDVQ